MDAHVAGAAAASRELPTPKGLPISPDTASAYRLPATKVVTGMTGRPVSAEAERSR